MVQVHDLTPLVSLEWLKCSPLVGMELDSTSNDNHGKGNRSFFQFKGFPGRVKSSRGIGETPRASKKNGYCLDQQERETFLHKDGVDDAAIIISSNEGEQFHDSKVCGADPMKYAHQGVCLGRLLI